MSDTIEYYFSIGSPWAYLGLRPLRELARTYQRVIRPFPVGILTENGAVRGKDRPKVRQQYHATDLARWAAWHGRPLKLADRPVLPDPSPAALAVVSARVHGEDWLELTLALQGAYWEANQDIADPEVRKAVANSVNLDGAAIVAGESAPEVLAQAGADLAQAQAAGIFGSPTYVIDGEAYWGQDRLAHVERHLAGNPLRL